MVGGAYAYQRRSTECFRQMVEEEGDNQAKAAAKLGVNQVTFWGWLSGSRNIGSDALWRALDAAGAHVVRGNDKFTDETVTEHELRAQLSAVKLDLAAARERAAVYKDIGPSENGGLFFLKKVFSNCYFLLP